MDKLNKELLNYGTFIKCIDTKIYNVEWHI